MHKNATFDEDFRYLEDRRDEDDPMYLCVSFSRADHDSI